MLTELIYKQLHDLQKLCRLANIALKETHGKDSSSHRIASYYSENRERLLDIIRELDLGHNVDWNEINGMLRTLESQE